MKAPAAVAGADERREQRRLKVSANVSILYPHLPFQDRFEAAARDGFECVEFWETEDPNRTQRAIRAASLSVSCINVPTGWEPADCGRMGDPDSTGWWRDRFSETAWLARSVGCETINVLAGRRRPGSLSRQRQTLVDNLAWACDASAGSGVRLVLEAVNALDRPGYLWPTVADARATREQVARPERVMLLYDAYHVHQSGGDVVATFAEHRDAIGHIQLADSPGRHEPGTGTMDVAAFLREVHATGYGGWIGLEYQPSASTTSESLRWTEGVREWLDGPLGD